MAQNQVPVLNMLNLPLTCYLFFGFSTALGQFRLYFILRTCTNLFLKSIDGLDKIDDFTLFYLLTPTEL